MKVIRPKKPSSELFILHHKVGDGEVVDVPQLIHKLHRPTQDFEAVKDVSGLLLFKY